MWAAGFHHVYGSFSLGARFETYDPFISLIFQNFFSGRGKTWITENADTVHWYVGPPVYASSWSKTHSYVDIQLTLRLLMSYIYMEHLFLMFLDHTRRSTVGRTPLDE